MKRKLRRIKRKLKRSNLLLKIITIIIVVLIVIFYILGETIIKDNNDYKKLTNESIEANKNLSIDTYNNNYLKEIESNKICNSKELSLLEEGLENYIKDYSNIIDKSIKTIKDEKITNLLTAQNYSQDGPAFTNSINFINTKNQELDNLNTELNNITNKIYYTKYIKERTKNKKTIERYKLLVKNIINNKDIELINKDITELKDILKTSNDIFIYLSRNNTAWYVESNEIVFTNQEVKTEYEKAINKIKR